jgi:hypothetical protein
MTNPNDPINPLETDMSKDAIHIGLTKREYFAAMAMQGILSGFHTLQPENESQAFKMASVLQGIANMAVRRADDLIQALNEQRKEERK